jgi:hypothetical protein
MMLAGGWREKSHSRQFLPSCISGYDVISIMPRGMFVYFAKCGRAYAAV